MKFRDFLASSLVVLLATSAAAQGYDSRSFEDAVNEAIADIPGVSFTMTEQSLHPMVNTTTGKSLTSEWAQSAAENAPEFGFVVYDAAGQAVDVFGGNAPFMTRDNVVEITGYELPEGYSVSTVGSAGYLEAVSEIAQRVDAPSDDVQNAVQTVKGASAYIVQELCSAAGRPTEITLNLTAGFKLAFSVETGSQFHWDLEVVCDR